MNSQSWLQVRLFQVWPLSAVRARAGNLNDESAMGDTPFTDG
jgi:hypothetical protein